MGAFDEFCAAGEGAVNRWISDALPEDESIEFKSGLALEKGSLSRTAKQHIGEELSATANSGGGALFLGIRTKRINGLDVPVATDPIGSVDLFASQLRFQLDTLVGPPIVGIRLEVASAASDVSSGYIAISIPRSERRPHMCRAPDRHTYFKRLGTSSVPMSPFEVEDQMLRAKNAEITARIQFERAGSIGLVRVFAAMVILQNDSDVSALNCWAGVSMEAMEFQSDRQHLFGFKVGPRVPVGRNFYAESHILIPPGGHAVVCSYQLYLSEKPDGGVDVRQPGDIGLVAARAPKMEVYYGCLNTRQKMVGRKLQSEDLEDLHDSGKLLVS